MNMSLAPSAFCVHGTMLDNVCVCDAGWENDLLFLRVNHCNTIAGYGLVVDCITIAVSFICQVLSAAWLVHSSTKNRHWKARTAMWGAQFSALMGIGMGASHLALGGPTWLFWIFLTGVVVNTFGSVNLVNDIFFDILKRDLGKREVITPRAAWYRQGSLVLGFASTFVLYFGLVVMYGLRDDDPAFMNYVTGLIFMVQPLCNVFSFALFITLQEILQVLNATDSQSDLIKRSRERVVQFRRVFMMSLLGSWGADWLMGGLTLANGGLWAWVIYPFIMIIMPAVSIAFVIVTFPLKRANTSSKDGNNSSKPRTSKVDLAVVSDNGGMGTQFSQAHQTPSTSAA